MEGYSVGGMRVWRRMYEVWDAIDPARGGSAAGGLVEESALEREGLRAGVARGPYEPAARQACEKGLYPRIISTVERIPGDDSTRLKEKENA